MISILKWPLATALCVLLLTACSDDGPAVFRPYDYEKHENARLDIPKVKSSVKIGEHGVILRRKYPFPLQRKKK